MLGLVGESGSGKSATALAILGLLGPAARVEGRCCGAAAQGQGITSIDLLQQPPVRPAADSRTRNRHDLPGADDGAESGHDHWPSGGRVRRRASTVADRREAKRKAIAALEAVAIPDAAQRYGDYPHQFSGGQRQRILIAMALINRPRLLIADEPTTALDVTVQAQILALLAELQRQHGLAMLFISHDLAVVGQVASRVAVMRAGQVVEAGPVARSC